MEKFVKGSLLATLALGSVGAAHALTFNEVQNTQFVRYFDVTVSTTDRLVLSLSGLDNQFDSLKFSFVTAGSSVPSSSFVAVDALPTMAGSDLKVTFNDARNTGAKLFSGQTYRLKVEGDTANTITGGQGTVTLSAINGQLVSAVPEPESYAMLLAGLGIMGGIARRRIQK